MKQQKEALEKDKAEIAQELQKSQEELSKLQK